MIGPVTISEIEMAKLGEYGIKALLKSKGFPFEGFTDLHLKKGFTITRSFNPKTLEYRFTVEETK